MNHSENRTLFVEPSDVLLFRDGKPFSAGTDHHASGVFPPSPVPLYGALRTAAFLSKGVRFKRKGLSLPPDVSPLLADEMGTWNRLGSMAISFFSLACITKKGCKLLFPCPLDVGFIDGDSRGYTGGKQLRFVPHIHQGPVKARVNFPIDTFRPIWRERHEKVRFDDADYYVNHEAFGKYLLSGNPPEPFRHFDEDVDREKSDDKPEKPFVTELRTSLEIQDHSQRADEGKLYSVSFTRVRRNIGFAVALQNATTLPGHSGVLRLGGESRVACYKNISLPDLNVKEAIRSKIKEKKKCTMVLVTPAPFTNGWYPDFINEHGKGERRGCSFQFVGCAVERRQTVGGWNIAQNCPYPARPAAPPGSVYFFESLKGNIDQFIDSLFGRSVCAGEDDQKRGLGLAYLGCWE